MTWRGRIMLACVVANGMGVAMCVMHPDWSGWWWYRYVAAAGLLCSLLGVRVDRARVELRREAEGEMYL
jgi:hypothetical protein